MSENTVDNDSMRRTTQEPPRTTPEKLVLDENIFKMKLYLVDHELALQIQDEASVVFRQLSMQQVLREAVHAGLPIVAKRYRAAVDAAIEAT